jgi:hypothetical protein
MCSIQGASVFSCEAAPKTHVESFCDEIAGLFGAASHEKTEAP